MPKVEIEVRRTVETTREESIIVEVDVPSHILDLADDEELHDWVVQQSKYKSSEVTRAFTGAWDVLDNRDDVTYDEVMLLDES
jgi:hypothetical protein